MRFVDKVKSQASALAEKAQEGAKAGQEKLSAMQAKRQADAMLLELGGLTYLERAGRTAPDSEERVTELVAQLAAHEATAGPVVVSRATPPPGETGTYVPQSGALDVSGEEDAGTPPATLPVAAPTALSATFEGGVPQAVVGGAPQSEQVTAPDDPSSSGLPAPSTLPAGSGPATPG